MKKKVLAMTMAAATMTAALTGCGNSSSSTTSSSTAANTAASEAASATSEAASEESTTAAESTSSSENVTLTMWIWDEAQAPATQAMIDEYRETHPNINVEITNIAGSDDYNTKMRAVVGTEDAPDIFWMNYNLASEYIPMGFVQDLTDMIDSHPDFDITKLNAGITSAYTVDGKIYGIPKDTDGYAVFYNKSLFDAAGVEYPSDDWTVDDFVEACKATTQGDVKGWANTGSDRAYFSFMYAYGGSPYTEDRMSANVNSEGSVEGMQVLLDLMKDGYAYDGNETAETDSSVLFTSGVAAMMIDGSWMISQYNDALGDNLGIATLPAGPSGIGSCGHGIAYATTTSNPHLEETYDFLAYLGSESAQVKQVEVVIPAYNDAVSEWEAVYPDLNLGAFVTALANNKPYLAAQNASAARSACQEYLGYMRALQYDTAQEAMDDAEVAMNDAINGN